MKSLLLALFGVATVPWGLVAGQCGYVMPGSGETRGVSQINFAVHGSGGLSNAFAIWQNGCSSMGEAYPSLSSSSDFVSGPGIVNVNVFFTTGTSPSGRCGQSEITYSQNGMLTGGNIFIYQYEVVNGQQVACASLPNYDSLVAHELGHALGIWDSYIANPGACVGAIMSEYPDYVFSDECQVVQQSFYTISEQTRDEQNAYCSSHCWTTCVNGSCPNNWHLDGCGDDCSPVVLDFGSSAYEFSTPQAGVLFDIDADGNLEHVGWPADPNRLAFLFMDRDGNGLPDNGGELFGNACRLKDGSLAPHGFAALAELDTTGDAQITRGDSAWTRLALWFDINRNGKAEPEEVLSLDDLGVDGLDVTPNWTGRRDRFGNMLRWKAMFRLARGHHVEQRPYYDVFLKIAR